MTSKDIFKGVTYDSLDKQVGGNHYNKMKDKIKFNLIRDKL